MATLTVGATDDKGVAKVVFMDDDEVICTDTAAPFTCAYQAKGTDLGRNTLAAVAYDALGQTASSVRPVVVTRFVAKSLSLKATPTKDTRAPYSFAASGALTVLGDRREDAQLHRFGEGLDQGREQDAQDQDRAPQHSPASTRPRSRSPAAAVFRATGS